ncbi:MAG: hypothetical protein A2Z24_01910 [Candidatus Woykebacteria bacterium RBG_16_44_10]|uniref:DUF5615 domain-containing protein n=1 Tax=Candidatus Woykebacteria bacterium RBG_16_44_10 TaxID=1802597 RepID=A0A1G1WFW3_9BACT|nr:MAG: hypothetical protein A2Z24_01910 [Candidatus Woykebacteria bacterium RBG_16_44_10]
MPPLKFLIDENVDFPVAAFLRGLGFDTKTVVEEKPSLADKDILTLANQEDRILITNDKDFGQLIFEEGLSHKGIILFRLGDESSQAKIKRFKELLSTHKDQLANHFIVVTETKVRVNEF